MNTRFPRQLALPLHFAALLTIAAAASQAPFALGEEPRPGALLDIVSRVGGEEVHLAFRYCPAGETFRAKPEPLPKDVSEPRGALQRKALAVSLKPFYITEIEVSRRQFRHILGQAALDRVNRRIANLKGIPQGDDYPICALTIDEAAAFCRRLKESAAGDAENADSLDVSRFRVPTHYEWQYACRATRTLHEALRSPHFGGWCPLESVPAAQQQDAKDLWKQNVPGRGDFAGTQNQMAELLQAVGSSKNPDDRTKAIAVLEAFLRLGLGMDRSLVKVGTVQAADSGKPNAWNIRNLHGNVFEWTVLERDPEKLKEVLLFLAGPQQTAPPAARCFFLAGAGYNHQLEKNPAEWVKFSIWGGEPFNVDQGAADARDFSEASTDAFACDFCPGLRVVRDRELSPAWLLVVRKIAVLPNAINDGARKELANCRGTIAEIGASAGDLSVLKYYESLANYRLRRVPQAADEAGEALSHLPDDDSYLDLLRQLIAQDATNAAAGL